jgi:chorismate mutase
MELKYYIIEGSALPDIFKKVIEVTKLLETDMSISVNSACQKANISRSTYYKYKNTVYEFYENRKSKIVTFSLNIYHEPGLLSKILDIIAGSKANILTINQNIPMNGIAIVVISIETMKMEISMGVEGLINKLRDTKGVKKVDILSRS